MITRLRATGQPDPRHADVRDRSELPAPHEPFDIDVWQYRWPTGAGKAELYDGVLIFSGEFDERDVEIAQRAYPGRQVVLNESDGIEIHPANNATPRSIFETSRERLTR